MGEDKKEKKRKREIEEILQELKSIKSMDSSMRAIVEEFIEAASAHSRIEMLYAEEHLRKFRYSLYSILFVSVVVSIALFVVFYYALNTTTIGLSFLGPLVTSIIGSILVLVYGRK